MKNLMISCAMIGCLGLSNLSIDPMTYDMVSISVKANVLDSKIILTNGKAYYMENGKALTGLFTRNGKTYYGPSWDNGALKTGLQVVNNKKYFFDEQTYAQKTGIVEVAYGEKTQKHYFFPNGDVALGFYTDSNGDTYYFSGSSGIMVYGQQIIDGKKYYFDEKTGKQQVGFVTINYVSGSQTHYFMKEGGIKQNGFETINGKTYYFAKDSGIMYKDINIIDNKKYYFHPNTGELLSGVYKASNGYSYYFDKNESTGVKTGLQNYNGNTYLFHDQSGIMQTGLFSVDKNLYYFDEQSGKALKNDSYLLFHVNIHFNSQGIMDSYSIEEGYEDDLRSKVIYKSLGKIGAKYTTDADGFVCSSFVTYLFENMGIDLWEHGAESFEQALYVKQNSLEISRDKLKPGDIIFWAKPNCDDLDCDHVDEVHHIALYLGNDKIIEANETRDMVDVQNITSDESYVLYSFANIVPSHLETIEAPTQIATKGSSTDQLEISWECVDLAEGYILYRKAPGESRYQQIAKLSGKDNTVYTDTAEKYSTYEYRIASYRNVNGKEQISALSDVVYGMRKLKAADHVECEVVGKSKVRLTWDKVEGAEGYIIYRRIGDGTFTYRYMVSGTTYTDTTASNSEYNFYRVYPYVTLNDVRQLGPSENYVYAKGSILAAENLSAVSAGKSRVALDWKKVDGAEGYIIYRKIGDGKFEYRYMVDGTTYTDTTASNSEYNFYRVYPYFTENKTRILGPSKDYKYAKGALSATTSLKAVATGSNKIQLTWNKVDGAEGYIIYRRIGDGKFEYRYMVSGTTYTDITASNSEYNFYRIYPYLTENGKRILGPSASYVYAKGKK